MHPAVTYSTCEQFLYCFKARLRRAGPAACGGRRCAAAWRPFSRSAAAGSLGPGITKGRPEPVPEAPHARATASVCSAPQRRRRPLLPGFAARARDPTRSAKVLTAVTKASEWRITPERVHGDTSRAGRHLWHISGTPGPETPLRRVRQRKTNAQVRAT